MGIQQSFIDKKIQKLLQKNKSNNNVKNINRLNKIAIFVDEYVPFNDAEFTNLQKIMNLNHTHFTVITFKEKKSNFNEFRGPVIRTADFNWSGKITSKEVLDFLNQDYDLLIDYTQANHHQKQLVVAMCSAAIKVGFSDAKDELYDFMIAINPSEIRSFNNEMVKYLTILKLL